jgi:hypothetical protein
MITSWQRGEYAEGTGVWTEMANIPFVGVSSASEQSAWRTKFIKLGISKNQTPPLTVAPHANGSSCGTPFTVHAENLHSLLFLGTKNQSSTSAMNHGVVGHLPNSPPYASLSWLDTTNGYHLS